MTVRDLINKLIEFDPDSDLIYISEDDEIIKNFNFCLENPENDVTFWVEYT